MRFLTNMSTQTRLYIVFGLMALLVALVAVAGIFNGVYFQRQVSDLRASVQTLERSGQAQAELIQEQISIKEALLTRDPRVWGQLYSHNAQFVNFLEGELLTDYDQATEDLLLEISSRRDAYDVVLQDVYTSAKRKNFDSAIAMLFIRQDADPVAGHLNRLMSDLAHLYAQDIRVQADQIDALAKTNANLGRWSILILAVLLLVSVYITSQITQPLHSLTNAVIAFQNNTYRPEMLSAYIGRKDELGQMARAFDAMATSISEANRLQAQFLQSASRFIPQQYLEFLGKGEITDVRLGDNVSAEMAVMFSDIRGFTSVSEKMTPQENFDFVNEYLKLVSPLVQENEGFIVKYLGDGMMAIFPYGVDDAVQAGIAKHRKVIEFNRLLAERGKAPIRVGIGIHTGHMMVGMIGEEKRIQGDAFSDSVNLTSRIEGLNKFFGTTLIISGDAMQSLKQPSAYKMRYLGKVRVKGRITPLALHEIYQGLPDDEAACREAARVDFERGIDLYTRGQFEKASQSFDAALHADPEDQMARYYLERCVECGAQEPQAGWDGVISMTDK